MIKKMFTIYDEKSEAFLQPFFMDTIGQAERAMLDCLSDPNHQFARHPSDYTLLLLGHFDDSSAEFTPDRKTMGILTQFKPNNVVNITEEASNQ